MVQFEQLVCGVSPDNPTQGLTVFSRSPGMGGAVSGEIVRLCAGWGEAPAGGLGRPAVLSFPLEGSMPALRGRLFAVIQVGAGQTPFFHAVVLAKAEYRDFGYNPFAVVRSGSFLQAWGGSQRLGRGSLAPPAPGTVFMPPPNPADVGLVDEALLLWLSKGKLLLDLEAPSAQSDRVLGLVIEAMPFGARESLRFASFSPQGENRYNLAACHARNTPFSSWQRLFMTLLNHGAPEAARTYVAAVRSGLLSGSLENVPRQTGSPAAPPAAGAPHRASPVKPEPLAESAPAPRSPSPIGPAAVIGPAGFPAARTYSGSAATPVDRGLPAPGGEQPGPGRSRLVRHAVPLRTRRPGRRLPALGLFLVVLTVLTVGWVYLDRSGKGRQWGIFDLANLEARQERKARTPSLLEVVDVGMEYERQLRRLQRGQLLPGADRDQALRRAQAELLAQAAGPLLVQTDLFLNLADEGIQQGHRPDREHDRLQALDAQGQVLLAEMSRLELSYFSFHQGILWRDLPTLQDDAVAARRDSLIREAGEVFAICRSELGTADHRPLLQGACRNVAGMASLLALFQERRWSDTWEGQMKRAAEMVPPTASPLTRAYRNNAFTLVRLKRAEHHEASALAAVGEDSLPGGWVSPAVKDILPELRTRAAHFPAEGMPPLLADVLRFYARLEDPARLVQESAASPRTLTELRNSGAVLFDPAAYGNLLDRIGLEAACRLLQDGAGPDQLPEELLNGLPPATVAIFAENRRQAAAAEAWDDLAELAGDSFFADLCRHRAQLAREGTNRQLEECDEAWAQGLALLADLRDRAAQGQDWTSIWIDLRGHLGTVLAAAPAVAPDDDDRTAQQMQAAAWAADLDAERVLEVAGVVVRLEAAVLTEPLLAVVELRIEGTERVFRSEPLRVGPAAPAGTGWVGAAELGWLLDLSPRQSLTARVLAVDTGTTLLEAAYPSLADRVGPGALGRPARSAEGSLVFRTGDRWWREPIRPEIP